MKMDMVAALAFLSCLIGALPAPAAAEDKPPIAVTNYANGETVRYPLVLLRGTLGDATLESVTVVNESSKLDSRDMAGHASKGRFKALAELVPGKNRLVVRADKSRIPFLLTYKPQTSPYKIRAVVFSDKTGDPTYDTPFKDDSQDYKAKWDAALKLMQTFTADEMYRQGYGRKTFNLELDGNGKVVVCASSKTETGVEQERAATMERRAEKVARMLGLVPYSRGSMARSDGNGGMVVLGMAEIPWSESVGEMLSGMGLVELK